MTTPTLDSVNADLQTTKASVPTLEETLTSLVIPCWEGSGGAPGSTCHWSYTATLLVAPITLNILSVGVSFEAWSLAVSDTAYWTATLEVGSTPSGWAALAVRSTQATGANSNGPIAARTPWTFNAATGSPWQVPAGQLLAMNWAPTPENTSGSPADMRLPVTYTIRYAAA